MARLILLRATYFIILFAEAKQKHIFKLFEKNDLLNYQKKSISLFTMTIKDGIDFLEFISDMAYKYQRFQGTTPSCGGDIDILVITKKDAFWYRHKAINKNKNELVIDQPETSASNNMK